MAAPIHEFRQEPFPMRPFPCSKVCAWQLGLRIVDLGELAKQLRCKQCASLLDLNNAESETKIGFASVLSVLCFCGTTNNVCTGKMQAEAESDQGNALFEVNVKASLNMVLCGAGAQHVINFLAVLDVPIPMPLPDHPSPDVHPTPHLIPPSSSAGALPPQGQLLPSENSAPDTPPVLTSPQGQPSATPPPLLTPPQGQPSATPPPLLTPPQGQPLALPTLPEPSPASAEHKIGLIPWDEMKSERVELEVLEKPPSPCLQNKPASPSHTGTAGAPKRKAAKWPSTKSRRKVQRTGTSPAQTATPPDVACSLQLQPGGEVTTYPLETVPDEKLSPDVKPAQRKCSVSDRLPGGEVTPEPLGHRAEEEILCRVGPSSHRKYYRCPLCPRVLPSSRGFTVHVSRKHQVSTYQAEHYELGPNAGYTGDKAQDAMGPDAVPFQAPSSVGSSGAGGDVGWERTAQAETGGDTSADPGGGAKGRLSGGTGAGAGDHQSQPKQFSCNIRSCSKKFQRESAYKNHLSKVHGVWSAFSCQTCGQQYDQLVNLKKHVSTTHQSAEDRRRVCKYCNQALPTPGALKKHIKANHPRGSKMTYYCDECPKTFGRPCELRTHKLRHSGARNYKCFYCDLTFMGSGNRLSHMRYIHERDPKFLCETCGASFHRAHILREHERVHSGEKPFQCERCAERFTKKEYLNIHMRTHTGERPYRCEVCGKSFTQRCSRSLHRRKVHGAPKQERRGFTSTNTNNNSSNTSTTTTTIIVNTNSSNVTFTNIKGNDKNSFASTGNDNLNDHSSSSSATTANNNDISSITSATNASNNDHNNMTSATTATNNDHSITTSATTASNNDHSITTSATTATNNDHSITTSATTATNNDHSSINSGKSMRVDYRSVTTNTSVHKAPVADMTVAM